MAPVEVDGEGVWGEVTSTIDWCEANYEVTTYMSEFCKLFLFDCIA